MPLRPTSLRHISIPVFFQGPIPDRRPAAHLLDQPILILHLPLLPLHGHLPFRDLRHRTPFHYYCLPGLYLRTPPARHVPPSFPPALLGSCLIGGDNHVTRCRPPGLCSQLLKSTPASY